MKGGARVEQYPYLATYYLGFNVKSASGTPRFARL